jgi:hypothetical protein
MSVSFFTYLEILPSCFHHSSGHPGFHPPCPGQDEDVLSDKHVKDGFLLPLAVPVSLR